MVYGALLGCNLDTSKVNSDLPLCPVSHIQARSAELGHALATLRITETEPWWVCFEINKIYRAILGCIFGWFDV